MKHEEIMNKAWALINELSITEDKDEYASSPNTFYLVENIYAVRDALASDMENGTEVEGETLEEFFTRHNIKWQ